MNPKAQMMSTRGYVKRTRHNVRQTEKNAWRRDVEVIRYINR
jgi:hypothetical protein